MSPEQRAAINRQNSAHSTGPTSESGRQTVSQNARTQGLCAQTHAILPGEEEAFAKHLEGYIKAYNPQTTPEHDLVCALAKNFWRLQRAHDMETAAFHQAFAEARDESPDAVPAVAHAAAFSDPQKNLRNIVLYAARIQREIDKTAARLTSLQEERKAAYARAEEEAILLTQLSNDHKKVSEAAAYFSYGAESADGAAPDHGGFVFSFDRVKAKIVRQGRLAEARARLAPSEAVANLVKGALV